MTYESVLRRSDVWCIGILAAKMATNKMVFEGKTDVKQIRKIVNTLGK